jgi:flagellin-specific chaperone FliS
MKYKQTVLSKLESVENAINGLMSMLSQPNLTREQLDQWYEFCKTRLEEIQTLINSQEESI